jgi:hypothetical protein
MKPVALALRAIRTSSKSRGIVLDPFGGSGLSRSRPISAGASIRVWASAERVPTQCVT